MLKSYIKFIDDLPFIGKLILCIPVLNILFSVYKLCRSLEKGDLIWIILGVLVIVPGATFMWLVDLLSLLFLGKVIWGC